MFDITFQFPGGCLPSERVVAHDLPRIGERVETPNDYASRPVLKITRVYTDAREYSHQRDPGLGAHGLHVFIDLGDRD